MYFLQFLNDKDEVCVGIVHYYEIFPLDTKENLYQLIMRALTLNVSLLALVSTFNKLPSINYDELIKNGRIIIPITHNDLSHMFITGTGLTHLNSTLLRTTMYDAKESLSDAQKIYQDGLFNGKPLPGKIGARPEWFYKGNGHMLKSTSDSLSISYDAESCGEEAEFVAVYVISENGMPYRIGFTLGNEFSDHALEKRNSYYLAQSKLCECAIGPEIYIGDFPQNTQGKISIERSSEIIWSKKFNTGYKCMTHSLTNIEHYLFKNTFFRTPGDVHILYLGADQISFSDDVQLNDGDTVSIHADFFHFPLINQVNKCHEIPDVNVQNI